MDQNELLRRLAAQAGGDADELEQAAKAAQRGDMRIAAQAAQKLMQTPEGARLAAQLRHIFGK